VTNTAPVTLLPISSVVVSTPVNVALQAEQTVIGRLLAMGSKANAAFAQIADIPPSYFSTEAHTLIWHGLKALVDTSTPISLIALQSKLDTPLKTDKSTTALERVGLAYLQDLMQKHATGIIADAARVVREYGVKRKGIDTANAIVKDMQTLSPQQALDSALKRLQDHGSHVLSLDGHAGQSLASGMKQGVAAVKARQEAYLSGDTAGLFMSTGYRDMDALLGGGLFRKEMTVIMADSNVGKSALSFNIALNAALNQGLRVVFIPLEMAVDKMINRAMSVLSGVPSSAIRTGRIDDLQIERLAEVSVRLDALEAARLFHFMAFDVLPNINTISAKLNQYVSMHGVDLIVIDQLSQEALSPVKVGTPMHEWLANAAAMARGWATTHNAHVIAPTQLSKARDQRADSTINLKDGAGSLGIVRSMENVIAISPLDNEPQEGRVERIRCQVLKQRDGAKGEFNLDLVKHLTRFVNEGEYHE
jgi:replicative DNA helicase